MDMAKVGFPLRATQRVNLFWGNSRFAIQIATCQANDAMREAREWFEENSHYFHLENFPPYQQFIDHQEYVTIDYGSYTHFLYLIPVNI